MDLWRGSVQGYYQRSEDENTRCLGCTVNGSGNIQLVSIIPYQELTDNGLHVKRGFRDAVSFPLKQSKAIHAGGVNGAAEDVLRGSGINGYHPAALTSHVMKALERLGPPQTAGEIIPRPSLVCLPASPGGTTL